MSESIIKGGRRKGFTTVYRDVAQDARVSLKARGLYLLMQSLPENWEYTIAGLAKKAGTGKDQIRSAINELLTVGYLVKEQTHDGSGKFAGNVYILQEESPPLSGNPTTENPITGKPSTENPTENNIYINIPPIVPQGGACEKRKSKGEPKWKPERFEAFWKFYRDNARKEDRAGAVREWDRLKPDDALIETMANALKAQLATPDWKRGIGIPYACRWLKNRRWEDVDTATDADTAPQRRYMGTRLIDGVEVDVYE